MKKILIATNMLLAGIVLFMACKTNSDDESKSSNPQKPTCATKICNDYSNVSLRGIVSGDIIQKMSQAYADDIGKASVNYDPNGKQNERDALSLNFDLEKVKNFIWHIENAACNAGCDSKKELGIRFYYIKYSSKIDPGSLPQDLRELFTRFPDRHTLVMVPTYKFKGEWYDFDYENIKRICKFDRIAISLNKFKAAGLINDGSGDNHGGIGPPPESGIYPTNPPEQ